MNAEVITRLGWLLSALGITLLFAGLWIAHREIESTILKCVYCLGILLGALAVIGSFYVSEK